MKNSRAFLPLLILSAGLPVLAVAQDDHSRALIPITLDGSCSGNDYQIFADDATSGYIYIDNVDGTGFSTISKNLVVGVGKPYAVRFAQSSSPINPPGAMNFNVAVKVPKGYTVLTGSYPPTIQSASIAGSQYTIGSSNEFDYYFEVVENASLGASVAGSLTRLEVGDFLFEMGLGTVLDGKSAGRLQVRSTGKVGSGYGFPTGSTGLFQVNAIDLIVPGTGGSVAKQTITNGFKVETGEVKAEALYTGTNQYTVSFYSGNNAGGYNSTAFATYAVSKPTTGLPTNAPNSSDCMKIVETQGSLVLTRYVFRSTTSDTWTIIEGSGTEQHIEEHVSTIVSGNRVETITTKDSTATAWAKMRRTWTPQNGADVLTKTEVWTKITDTNPSQTTNYEYFATAGQLKKTTYPNAGTTEYTYYTDNARFGRVNTITEPWSTGSGTVTKVTTYDYTGSTGGVEEYVLSKVTTLGGSTTVGKSTYSYDFSTTSPEGLALVVCTATDYAAASTSYTQITTTYEKSVDAFFADKPFMVKSANGLQRSYRYEKGTYSGGTFTPGSGNASRTWVAEGSCLGGTATTSIQGLTFASIGLVANQSTLTQTVRDAQDNVMTEKIFVWDGTSWDTSKPIKNTVNTWLDGVRQSTLTEINGAVQEWTWNGNRLATMKDSTGIERDYAYDSVGRLSTVTKTALASDGSYDGFSAVVTTYGYDPMNNRISEQEASGSLSRTNDYVFDAASRKCGYLMADGRLESTEYTLPGSGVLQADELLPSGGHRTTQTLIDGKIGQITGTAVVAEYHTYSYDSSTGFITTKVCQGSSTSNRWQQITTDWLGRPTEKKRPAFNSSSTYMVETPHYDSHGRLDKTSRTSLADEINVYDVMGHVVTTGTDFSGNGSLEQSSASDRLTDFETVFYKDGNSDWWTRASVTVYGAYSSSTSHVASRDWTRLTGFASNTLSDSGHEDNFGNRVNTTVVVDRTKRRLTKTVTDPGITAANAVTVSNNGLVVKETSPDLRYVTRKYDDLGRLYQTVDSTNGTTTYTYKTVSGYNTDQVDQVKDPNNVYVATYTYDSAGRVTSTKNANPTTATYTYFEYDAANRKTKQWGGGTYPASFTYTDYGELYQQSTYQTEVGTHWEDQTWPTSYTGSANTTTFAYDSYTGLLTTKTDPSSNVVTNTYNDRGLIATRTWGRRVLISGVWTHVQITYTYATNSTELSGKTYNDGTTSVSFTYNRLGQPSTVADAAGTRSFTYNTSSTLELQTETLDSTFYASHNLITYGYDTATGSKGRPNAVKLGYSGYATSDQDVSYGYDTTGRFYSLAGGGQTFTYAYESNCSHLHQIANTAASYTDTLAYDSHHDWVKRRTTVASSTTVADFDYVLNPLGEFDSVIKTGSLFNGYGTGNQGLDTTYGYDTRSQVKSEATQTYVSGTATDLTGRQDSYTYDLIGNRATAVHNSSSASYTPNVLNQYSDRAVSHIYDVTGLLPGSTVTVGGSSSGVTRQGSYYFDAYTMGNTSTAAAYTSALTVADNSTPANTLGLAPFLAKTTEAMSYDEDGNLTSDGRWDYIYDGEGRLACMYTHAALCNSSPIPDADARMLSFTYDYLGRRVRKTVYSGYNHSTYTYATTFSDERVVYNGWNAMVRLNAASSNALVASYFWGLDIAGPGQRAGGIGALLLIKDNGCSFLPAYDALGNLHALTTVANVTFGSTTYYAGAIVAGYEYDAFGKTIRQDGPYAPSNPFRFATKYTDSESTLVYFGARFYAPGLGRFINRDPIEEQGGLNLYAFCGNNGINKWDYLGNDAFMVIGDNPGGDHPMWFQGDGEDTQDRENGAKASAEKAACDIQNVFQVMGAYVEMLMTQTFLTGTAEQRGAIYQWAGGANGLAEVLSSGLTSMYGAQLHKTIEVSVSVKVAGPTSSAGIVNAVNRSPSNAPGRGFGQPTSYGCTPTAIREVLLGATTHDPGDLMQAMADANGDPNHDWSQNGMWPTFWNLVPVMHANGADVVEVSYHSTAELLDQVGGTPVAVTGQWSGSTAHHEVTLRTDPAIPGNYIVTNPTGQVFLGTEISVTRNQVLNGIPVSGTANSPILNIIVAPAFTAVVSHHP